MPKDMAQYDQDFDRTCEALRARGQRMLYAEIEPWIGDEIPDKMEFPEPLLPPAKILKGDTSPNHNWFVNGTLRWADLNFRFVQFWHMKYGQETAKKRSASPDLSRALKLGYSSETFVKRFGLNYLAFKDWIRFTYLPHVAPSWRLAEQAADGMNRLQLCHFYGVTRWDFAYYCKVAMSPEEQEEFSSALQVGEHAVDDKLSMYSWHLMSTSNGMSMRDSQLQMNKLTAVARLRAASSSWTAGAAIKAAVKETLAEKIPFAININLAGPERLSSVEVVELSPVKVITNGV